MSPGRVWDGNFFFETADHIFAKLLVFHLAYHWQQVGSDSNASTPVEPYGYKISYQPGKFSGADAAPYYQMNNVVGIYFSKSRIKTQEQSSWVMFYCFCCRL